MTKYNNITKTKNLILSQNKLKYQKFKPILLTSKGLTALLLDDLHNIQIFCEHTMDCNFIMIYDSNKITSTYLDITALRKINHFPFLGFFLCLLLLFSLEYIKERTERKQYKRVL